MNSVQKAETEIFKNIYNYAIEGNYKEELDKTAQSKVGVKIPFGDIIDQSDKELWKVIKQYGLEDPEQMWKFIVEFAFACIETINDGSDSIRADLLDNELAKIESVKDLIGTAYNEKRYEQCFYTLSEVFNNLMKKINRAIQEIQEVDNRTDFEFLIKAPWSKNKVKSAVKRSSMAMIAYFETLSLIVYIGERLGEDVSNYILKAENYIDGLVKDKHISLMHAYDSKNTNTIWVEKSFVNRVNRIEAISTSLKKII